MRFLVIVILSIAVFSVFANEMTVPIHLDASAIQFENAGIYTSITGDGMELMENEGEPSLPQLSISIAIPTGCAATDIEVVDAVYTDVRGSFTVLPAIAPMPLSVERDENYSVEPDPEIYNSSTDFPEYSVTFEGSSVIMGIPIAYVRVNPVKWNPASGSVEILTDLTLNVTYESSPEASTVSRRSIQSELRSQQIVRNSVVNPEAVSASGAAIVDSKELAYGEYVIITCSEYESYAQEIADWKTSKGVPANVYTLAWIDSQYSFYDTQQNTRAFLSDCITEGAEYVLIYGDDDKVEGRDAQIHAGTYTMYPPVDLYFSDINDPTPGDDQWDSNDNHIWGERGIDNVDYHPDLWVGRASVNTETDCTVFNEKVFIYERIMEVSDFFETTPIEERIGYTTEMLWPGYYGSASAEYISSNVPSVWEEAKCYGSTGSNNVTITWNMINDGPHHLFHASHGSKTSFSLPGGSYTKGHMLAQNNISSGNLPAIWNSISCEIGWFDYSIDCLADAWNNAPNGGGFGAWNARYGWGGGTPGWGDSELLCRYFYEAMWLDDDYHLGVTHLMGTDKMCPPSNAYRDWCVKEYNLFGDPELPMWFEDAPNLDADHPIYVSSPDNVTVTVTSGGSPVSGARVCLQMGDWQTGEIYEVGLTDGSGSVTLSISPSTSDTISVVAWARDYVSYQGIMIYNVGIEEGDTNPEFINNVSSIYPSPAMSSATIPFSLANSGTARVDVYDVSGRIVTTLAAEEMAAGEHSIVWNLEDTNGMSIPSGIYHVRIAAADWTGTTNLVVVR